MVFERSWGLEEGKYHTHPPEQQEGQFGNRKASILTSVFWKTVEQILLGGMYKEQDGYWKTLYFPLFSVLRWRESSRYCLFGLHSTFQEVSHRILPLGAKLEERSLNRLPVNWVENRLKALWRAVWNPAGCHQRCSSGLTLLNVFTDNAGNGMACTQQVQRMPDGSRLPGEAADCWPWRHSQCEQTWLWAT